MTEGGGTRMKRNGARMFKNPPQPHMCIQVFIQGSTAPCYVNVLSWDKIEMPCRPSQPIPLYGGMRLPPPRTKTEAVVFAVMANTEILRMNGKNAKDPKKRSSLIELLLEFVEAMNAGIVFTRQYTILKDRDITGELKEVWNAVQAKRDKEQPPIQQETWIDAQPPPVPQYTQYQDPQQQDYTAQPPQYHSSVAYGRAMTNEGVHYDNYVHPQPPPTTVLSQNEQMYHQSGQVVPQQYHTNVRIAQDRYNYRERGRENPIQNIPQQSCPAYPTPQYQFQQLPRQMVPQYVNSNMHHNANLNYSTPTNSNVNPVMNASLNPPFQPYMPFRQRVDNTMHADMRRMQQQQQQMHMNHVQPVPQYEPNIQFNTQNTWMNVFRLGKPHMGVTQKNNASKRQINSPTHSKQNSCTNCHSGEAFDTEAKPKSPVKVLQRETSAPSKQDTGRAHEENTKTYAEKISLEESISLQAIDYEESQKKNDSPANQNAESSKQHDDQEILEAEQDIMQDTTNVVESAEEKLPQNPKDTNSTVTGQIAAADQKVAKTKIIVIKGNKYKDNNKNSGGQSQDKNRTVRRIRYVNDQKTNDSPKRSQTTVNSIIKSVFKINPGISGEEPSSKRKTNGQSKDSGKGSCENEDTQPGYTILKKADSSNALEDVVSGIAQLSIQDCKETNELSAVLS